MVKQKELLLIMKVEPDASLTKTSAENKVDKTTDFRANCLIKDYNISVITSLLYFRLTGKARWIYSQLPQGIL